VVVSFIGGGPGENHRPVANREQTVSQHVVHLALIEIYYIGLFSKLCLVWLQVVISNPARGEVYLIQHYVIKFVSVFFHFLPTIKLTTML
jgi:hypothetical protein